MGLWWLVGRKSRVLVSEGDFSGVRPLAADEAGQSQASRSGRRENEEDEDELARRLIPLADPTALRPPLGSSAAFRSWPPDEYDRISRTRHILGQSVSSSSTGPYNVGMMAR